MTVKKLKEIIQDLPDEMLVVIPANPTTGFDGCFLSPCEKDSEALEMGGDENMSDEDFETAQNLGTLKMDKYFVLVPCGYFAEHDQAHKLN